MEAIESNRSVTTLFMLMSVDGKISTGATDDMDVDWDFATIDGFPGNSFYDDSVKPLLAL